MKEKRFLSCGFALLMGVIAIAGCSGQPAKDAPASDTAAQTTAQAEGQSSAPLKRAEVPYITIRGEQYSTDLRDLRLENMGLTD